MDLILSPSNRLVPNAESWLEAFLSDPRETGTAYLDYQPTSSSDSLVPEDLAYSLLMNSNVTGRTFITVWEQGSAVGPLLASLPSIALENSTVSQREDVVNLICEIASWPHIKVSVATKLLHKKRPALIPILDNRAIFGAYLWDGWEPPSVESLSESVDGSEWIKVATALEAIYLDTTRPENVDTWLKLADLARQVFGRQPSRIELLDMVWWRYFRDREPLTRANVSPAGALTSTVALATSGGTEVFVDDDDGYTWWLAQHPNGYVLNCNRKPLASYLPLHPVWCGHLRHPGAQTAAFIKVCSDSRGDIESWAKERVGADPSPCSRCP